VATRVIPSTCTLAFHHVEETSAGRVIAVMNDGTILAFDTAADVAALIEGLGPVKARLEVLEATAGSVVAA
jgi:hypothetical protein